MHAELEQLYRGESLDQPTMQALIARVVAGEADPLQLAALLVALKIKGETPAEIAGAAALSPYHFSRSFKATIGTTPVRYVWARRVELTKRLLRTAMPLIDVAAAAGFSSQSSFTTAFKQATGATPAAWRRAI